MPMRELFYAPPAALKDHSGARLPSCSGTKRSKFELRKGPGYIVLAIAFSRLRYSHGVEENIRRALSETFGPVSLQTLADCGAVSLLLFYFDLDRLDHPIEEDAVRPIVAPLITNWEDRVSAVLAEEHSVNAKGAACLTDLSPRNAKRLIS